MINNVLQKDIIYNKDFFVIRDIFGLLALLIYLSCVAQVTSVPF